MMPQPLMRLLAVLLLLLNGIYFVWSSGFFRAYGWAPQVQAEPQRITQQINPQAIRLLTRQELSSAEKQAQAEHAVRVCLQAGPIDDARKAALSPLLEAALPVGAWQWVNQPVQVHWIVYMGQFVSQAALQKKLAELASMKLPTESLRDPALEPGLSLGGFDSQALAEDALVLLGSRGVRHARVVQERVGGGGNQLRLPAVDAGLQAKLGELRSALGVTPLGSCDPTP